MTCVEFVGPLVIVFAVHDIAEVGRLTESKRGVSCARVNARTLYESRKGGKHLNHDG